MIMKRFISYINRKRSQEASTQASDLHLRLYQGCKPPRHQILRIDREEMIDDVISHDEWRHLGQKCSLIPIDVYST